MTRCPAPPTRVHHPSHGSGTVVDVRRSVDGKSIIIAFDSGVRTSLAWRFAKAALTEVA